MRKQTAKGERHPARRNEKKFDTMKKIRLWATALDKFQRHLDGYVTDKEVCDTLNRVPMEMPTIAACGTLFNALVDALVGALDESGVTYTRHDCRYDAGMVIQDRQVWMSFPAVMVEQARDLYEEAAAQCLLSRSIVIEGVEVELYGYADYISPTWPRAGYHDLKLTASDKLDHFERGWQRVVYPWADHFAAGGDFYYDVFRVHMPEPWEVEYKRYRCVSSSWTEERAEELLREMLGGQVLPFIADHAGELEAYNKKYITY